MGQSGCVRVDAFFEHSFCATGGCPRYWTFPPSFDVNAAGSRGDGEAAAVLSKVAVDIAAMEDEARFRDLLRGLDIERPNHVRCADIASIPVQQGFLYLVAIMDRASRHVLAWRLSNTLDANSCVEALDEALPPYGAPEIFSTDQSSQS